MLDALLVAGLLIPLFDGERPGGARLQIGLGRTLRKLRHGHCRVTQRLNPARNVKARQELHADPIRIAEACVAKALAAVSDGGRGAVTARRLRPCHWKP